MPEKNSFSWGQPKYGIEKAEALNEIIDFHGKDTIAAVIVEPIAGSTGVLVPFGIFRKIKRNLQLRMIFY